MDGTSRELDASIPDGDVLRGLAVEGIDLDAVTNELEREGVRNLCTAYQRLLDCIAEKRAFLRGNSPQFSIEEGLDSDQRTRSCGCGMLSA
jgi:hypothetical protein